MGTLSVHAYSLEKRIFNSLRPHSCFSREAGERFRKQVSFTQGVESLPIAILGLLGVFQHPARAFDRISTVLSRKEGYWIRSVPLLFLTKLWRQWDYPGKLPLLAQSIPIVAEPFRVSFRIASAGRDERR